MNKVSRSFALVIPALEEPLNYYLSTAYLICRVVDNIEDCQQPFEWKQSRFTEFSQLIQNPTSAPDILAIWEQESWPGLTDDEQQMMGREDGMMLWDIYARIPADSRDIIALRYPKRGRSTKGCDFGGATAQPSGSRTRRM